MFATWGKIVSRVRWAVVVITILFLALAGIWGTTLFGRLSDSTSLDDPSSESQQITNQIDDRFGKQTVDVIGLYTNPNATVTDPQYRSAVQSAAAKSKMAVGVA